MEQHSATLAAGAVILFLAYLVRGVSGFGSALISVPLLAHFLPLTLVVPLLTLLDTIGSVFLGHADWRHRKFHPGEIRRMLPTAVLGTVLGIVLLKGMPEDGLRVALGALIMLFGVRAALRLGGDRIIRPQWAYPAGFAGGVIDALFSTGGPPVVIYLTHRIHDKSALRGTLSLLFLISGSFRILGFLLAGLLWEPQLAIAVALGVPVMLLGLYAGHHIHLAIRRDTMLAAVGLLLIGSGLSIGMQGWRGLTG